MTQSGAAARGAFILFEGVDRCGKSTQARLLVEALKRKGERVDGWNFPDRSSSASGAAINAFLSGAAEYDDAGIHQLFSDNRWEKAPALLSSLRTGTTLVVDRYAYSGVAYSAAKGVPQLGLQQCRAPDAGLPAPDLVVYLEASSELVAARAGFGDERYEKAEFQDRVRAAFAQLKEPRWLVLDASQPVAALHEQVVAEVLRTIERCKQGAPVLRLWDYAPLQQLPQQLRGAAAGGADAQPQADQRGKQAPEQALGKAAAPPPAAQEGGAAEA